MKLGLCRIRLAALAMVTANLTAWSTVIDLKQSDLTKTNSTLSPSEQDQVHAIQLGIVISIGLIMCCASAAHSYAQRGIKLAPDGECPGYLPSSAARPLQGYCECCKTNKPSLVCQHCGENDEEACNTRWKAFAERRQQQQTHGAAALSTKLPPIKYNVDMQLMQKAGCHLRMAGTAAELTFSSLALSIRTVLIL